VVREPVEDRNFSPHHHVQTGSGSHTISFIHWVPGSSLGEEQQGLEADHSPQTSAEVKNAWSYTSTPQYAFMAWCSLKKQHKDRFTLTLCFMKSIPAWLVVNITPK
jgi:hypothetical protein